MLGAPSRSLFEMPSVFVELVYVKDPVRSRKIEESEGCRQRSNLGPARQLLDHLHAYDGMTYMVRRRANAYGRS